MSPEIGDSVAWSIGEGKHVHFGAIIIFYITGPSLALLKSPFRSHSMNCLWDDVLIGSYDVRQWCIFFQFPYDMLVKAHTTTEGVLWKLILKRKGP